MALGAAAGLMLGLFEIGFVVVGRPQAFDSTPDRVRFAFCLAGLLGGAGGVLGAAGGGLFHLLQRWAERLAGSARAEEGVVVVARWRLRLATLVSAPAAVAGVLSLLGGRRVRELPARPLLLAAAALLAVAALYGAYVAAHKMLRAKAAAARAALATASIGGALLLYVVDGAVLPRLYPAFHLGLEAAEAGLLVLAAALLLHRSMRPRRAMALVLLVASLASARWSLRQLSFWAPLRAAAFEETTVCATVLGAAVATHVAPRALRPPEHLAPLTPPAAAALPPGPRAPDADIFLITVDAMRGDRLDPRVAPRLSALADKGTRFAHAYSAVPHTSFSVTSLLTGKFAWSLAAIGEPLEGHETLADLFRRERYKTAAFFPPAVFFIDHDRFAALERQSFRFEYVKYEFMAAPGRTEQVIRFLEAEKPDRVFLWVHYFDPHEPYQVHPRGDGGAYLPEALDGGSTPEVEGSGAAAGTALDRYDDEVRYTDAEVGRLVDWIGAHRSRAIVAFTADHGEEFGEHGGRYHGTTLYEEQVRVPLFVVGLGGAPVAEGRVIEAPVSLVDVAPTLLALADQVVPVRMRGRDLSPWMGRAAPPPEERIGPAFSEINARKLIARGSERLVCDVSRDFCELFDLASDPGEQRNLAGRAPDRVAALRAELDVWMRDHSAFERAPAAGSEAERAQQALERSRMGDRTAAPEVARLLSSSDAVLVERGAEALLRLPEEPAIRDAVFAAHRAHPEDLLVSALALRAGDTSLADPLARLAARPGALPPSVLGEIALALAAHHHPAAPATLRSALAAVDNEELERRLLRTVGESGDKGALATLLGHLETTVRTRYETVHAIGELRDRRAVTPLVALLPGERYVTVRAEMVRVLGQVAAARDRRAVTSALAAQRRVEAERVVLDEIDAVLSRWKA